jgi:hypothetical protein
MCVTSTDSARKASSSQPSRQLSLYSAAAAAAGVSMLALAQPAAGEVVVTKKTIPLIGNVSIDINSDGISDFAFYDHFSFGSAGSGGERRRSGTRRRFRGRAVCLCIPLDARRRHRTSSALFSLLYICQH